ncbi:MAG: hypothetical protein JWN85_4786 [Gammaproteobacteria bacterium]|nr:hypothetical protein [Gammaproteobacteria bacterium]
MRLRGLPRASGDRGQPRVRQKQRGAVNRSPAETKSGEVRQPHGSGPERLSAHLRLPEVLLACSHPDLRPRIAKEYVKGASCRRLLHTREQIRASSHLRALHPADNVRRSSGAPARQNCDRFRTRPALTRAREHDARVTTSTIASTSLVARTGAAGVSVTNSPVVQPPTKTNRSCSAPGARTTASSSGRLGSLRFTPAARSNAGRQAGALARRPRATHQTAPATRSACDLCGPLRVRIKRVKHKTALLARRVWPYRRPVAAQGDKLKQNH